MTNIIELQRSDKSEPLPQGNENNTPLPNTTTEQLYANLLAQERQSITSIRDIRQAKKEILDNVAPPRVKNLTAHQYLRGIYRQTTKDFLKVLRAMGVDVLPHHVLHDLAVRANGVPGDGTRQALALYFPSNDATEPIMIDMWKGFPEDAALSSYQAIGYTTVVLEFKVGDETIKVVGQTICGADDHYNGNVGVIFALRNAFDKIKARGIDTPILALDSLIQGFQKMVRAKTFFN